MNCTKCQETTVPCDIRLERRFGALYFDRMIQGSRCEKCNEEFIPGPELGKFEKGIALQIANSQDQLEERTRKYVMTPEILRFMRKTIPISIQDVTNLLG